MNHQNLVSNTLIRVNRKEISKLMFRALAPRQSEGLWSRPLQSTPRNNKLACFPQMCWYNIALVTFSKHQVFIPQRLALVSGNTALYIHYTRKDTHSAISSSHHGSVCILLVSPFRWADICCVACWEVSWLWCVDWVMWIKRWSRHTTAIHEPVHSTGRHQDWPQFLANPWFCRLLGAQPRSTYICRNYCSFPCAQLHNYCSFSVGVEVVWSAAWF